MTRAPGATTRSSARSRRRRSASRSTATFYGAGSTRRAGSWSGSGYGQRVECLARGEVTIVGLTDAPVPWPIGKTKRAKSLVHYRDLARAVRREANRDVARLFGVTGQTVTKWRKALGVPANNRGTLRRRVEAGKRNRKALAAMHAKARDPVRRAKIAAAKRGKPRPRSVFDALRRASLGRKLPAEHRAKMSAAHKRRGTIPPAAGKPWAAWEDWLLYTLPPSAVASKSARTLAAVYMRRAVLGRGSREGAWWSAT